MHSEPFTLPFSVGDDFEEVEEDENLDDLQEGEVSICELAGQLLATLFVTWLDNEWYKTLMVEELHLPCEK